MAMDASFQTPANRRSPAQLGNKNSQEREDGNYGLVTNAFEALKPYAYGAFGQPATWLPDNLMEASYKNLNIVMPPIGYEADTRTFHNEKDKDKECYKARARIMNDKYDLYGTCDARDQGTISNIIDSEVDEEEDLNEFGFGYRNGFVYNKQNSHTPESLVYITNKHHSMIKVKSVMGTPAAAIIPGGARRGSRIGSASNSSLSGGYTRYRGSDRYRNKLSGNGAHRYDDIEDVTSTGASSGNRRRRSSVAEIGSFGPSTGEYVSTATMFAESKTSGGGGSSSKNKSRNNKNKNKNIGNNVSSVKSTRFVFNNSGYEMKNKNNIVNKNENDIEIENEGNREEFNNIAWMSRFPQFQTTPRKEVRKESFVSEYSNYTPDGQQRPRARETSKKKLTYSAQ